MKKALTTLALIAVMTFGTTFANAGIIVGGLTSTDEPCTEKADVGIIVGGLTGIIVGGFTGIIVGGAQADEQPEVCGIIVGG